ncbi:MAG TPA: PAS domain-containing protein [Steroidobacteraceae bacterium]|nr:PAS domain-containing protein [Steroidobacteraceae bacterium]
MFSHHGTKRLSSAATGSQLGDCDFRTLFDVSAHPIALLAPDGTIIEANAAYVTASLRPREALIGQKLFAIFPGSLHDGSAAGMHDLRQSLDIACRTRAPHTVPLLKSNTPSRSSIGSEERYWSITNTPVVDSNEAVRFILHQPTEISELCRLRRLLIGRLPSVGTEVPATEGTATLQAIEESNRLLGAERNYFLGLFHQAPGFIAVVRGPEHTLTLANAAFYEVIGHRNIIGQRVGEALAEINGQGYLELLDDVYRTGQVFVGRNMQISVQRLPGAHLDGMYIDLLFQPLLDDDGAVTGIFIQGTDVTERKLAEDSFRRANETLEQRIEERTAQLLTTQEQTRIFFEYSAEYHVILSAMNDGTFICEDINPAALSLYGVRREEVIGRNIMGILKPEEARRDAAHLRGCLSTGQPYRYETTVAGRIVEAVAVPVRSAAGKPARLIVSARDVTESRALEGQLRQAQKMEAVGQLTGGIAHDFNNLLTVIIGNLDRLERQLPEDSLRRAAGMALDGARRAATLTHRLLAFSRKQPLEPKAIDVNALIGEMSEILQRTLGETIAVEAILEPRIWTTSADPNQVENALLNLALNARDAMPNGGRLSIYTSNVWLDAVSDPDARRMTPGEYVRIAVRDTGAGMAPDVLAHAFEPFFTTKDVGQGSGLGLPMIYGFIKQSGGHISIDSAIGAGTTVNLYLPRLLQAALEPTRSEPAPKLKPVGRKSILAVEDDAYVREYTVSSLRELGHDVVAAANGAEALRILSQDTPFDVLFTDIVLPGGLNGRDLARMAQERRPGLKVLFTTGYERHSFDTADQSLSLLPKPFTVSQIGSRIAALFDAAES